MNNVDRGSKSCEKVRGYLDAYLSRELLMEANNEVSKHLEHCNNCATALETRIGLKKALQRAVRREEAPPKLREKIRNRIRTRRFTLIFPGYGSPWALAATASLLLLFTGWGSIRVWNLWHSRSLSGQSAAILNIGAGDHVTCAINHAVSQRRYTLERMARELGPTYSGLVPIVSGKISEDYEVVVAHQCKVRERDFVHVILKRDDSVLSLVITRKNGESFPRQDRVAVTQASGISFYAGREQNHEVTAFETRDHLAFVVSNQSREKNLQLAASLAPSVRQYLVGLEI